MKNLLPIRKVAVGLASAAVVYVVRFAFGVDLGPEAVADAINLAVGFGAAYLAKDPRVVDFAEDVDDAIDDLAEFAEDHPAIVAEAQRVASEWIAQHDAIARVIDEAKKAAGVLDQAAATQK